MGFSNVGVNLVVRGLSLFQKDVKKADNSVSDFSKNMQKYHRVVGLAMAAAGSAIIGIGVAAVKSFAASAAAVQTLADETGLSVETIWALQYAASQTGGSLEGLDTGMSTLDKTITDAQAGYIYAIDAFDALGLKWEDLATMSPEEKFMAVMTALGNVADESDRAEIANALFGKSIADNLLPMVGNANTSLGEYMQKAKDLGLVYDETGTKKGADFNQSLLNLQAAFKGLMDTIGLGMTVFQPLIDALTWVITKYTEWAQAHPGLNQALVIFATVLGVILVVTGLLTVASWSLAAGFLAVLWPVALVVAAIAAVIAIGVLMVKHWDDIVLFFKIVWDAISNGFSQLWNSILRGVASFVNIFIKGLNILINAANWIPGVNIKLIPLVDWGSTPGLAFGGMSGGGMYKVGERGPEVVSLPPGAQVSPISNSNTYNITENYARPESPQGLNLTMQALAMYTRT